MSRFTTHCVSPLMTLWDDFQSSDELMFNIVFCALAPCVCISQLSPGGVACQKRASVEQATSMGIRIACQAEFAKGNLLQPCNNVARGDTAHRTSSCRCWLESLKILRCNIENAATLQAHCKVTQRRPNDRAYLASHGRWPKHFHSLPR